MSIFSPSTNSTPTVGQALPPDLQKAMGKVTELGSLPEVTTRIIQVVEDPRTTARDIQEVVQTDPALAAKLLRIVNSAFYGLPSQISTLDRAILMLGLTAVKNLAMAMSLSRLLRGGPINDKFDARDLWTHSVAVAVCARMLVTASKCLPPNEAFVAGLVHDMGLIVARQIAPDKLAAVVNACVEKPQSFRAVERNLIGADHQTLGGALAARWKFPPGLRYAIAYHHEPQPLQPEFQKIAATIYVADTLCCAGEFGFWLTGHDQEISEEILGQACLTREQLGSVLDNLPENVREAEQLFSTD